MIRPDARLAVESVVFLLILVGFGGLWMAHFNRYHTIDYNFREYTKAKTELRDIEMLLRGHAWGRHDDPPPLTNRQVRAALTRDREIPYPIFQRDPELLLDVWGREVLIVLRGEQIIGLASAGQDGEWEAGEGDDILVDVNIPPKLW